MAGGTAAGGECDFLCGGVSAPAGGLSEWFVVDELVVDGLVEDGLVADGQGGVVWRCGYPSFCAGELVSSGLV